MVTNSEMVKNIWESSICNISAIISIHDYNSLTVLRTVKNLRIKIILKNNSLLAIV